MLIQGQYGRKAREIYTGEKRRLCPEFIHIPFYDSWLLYFPASWDLNHHVSALYINSHEALYAGRPATYKCQGMCVTTICTA